MLLVAIYEAPDMMWFGSSLVGLFNRLAKTPCRKNARQSDPIASPGQFRGGNIGAWYHFGTGWTDPRDIRYLPLSGFNLSRKFHIS